MPPHRLEITISPGTLARLDEIRGHEKRASFVKRVLEEALYESQSSEPPRAPVEKPVANVLGSKVRRVPSSRQAALNKAKGL